MNILVLGATGGTGRRLVEQALAQGHVVTAFARNPGKIQTEHSNLKVAHGDILRPESLEPAIQGQDAVLSALGVRVSAIGIVLIVVASQLIAKFAHLAGPLSYLLTIGAPIAAIFFFARRTTTLSEGTRNVVRVMEKLGVKRFICESSLGIGDSKGQLGPVYNFIVIPVLLRGIFADKEVQETIIKESSLQWVIVRPGALTNGPRTGKYRAGFANDDGSIRGKISRADVADFMLLQLVDDTYLGKTPGLSY